MRIRRINNPFLDLGKEAQNYLFSDLNIWIRIPPKKRTQSREFLVFNQRLALGILQMSCFVRVLSSGMGAFAKNVVVGGGGIMHP